MGKFFANFTSSLVSWALAVGLVLAIIIYGPGLLIFHAKIPEARASALSFICASSAAATSASSCSGEQAGDLLLVAAFKTASSTIPTLPAGWNNINTATNTAGSTSTRTTLISGWNTAASSSSNSGTWTNASEVVMQVYRGQAASPIGNNATQGGSNSGTLVTYGADNLSVADGSSWFAGFAVRNTADAQMANAPLGMQNRTSTPATPFAAGHDNAGPTASNWVSTDVTGFSASAKFTSIVIEIKASPTITVGATGTQVSSMAIPSTGNYVGGAFTFIRDIGSTTVNSITLTESGTVNAFTNTSNVIIWYKQQAICTASIPSGAAQFNSPAANFGVGDVVTVSGSMTVGTSQVCAYLQLDIGSGASNGDTLSISINAPVFDVSVSNGSVTGPTPTAPSGSTFLGTAGPTTDMLLRGGEFFSGGSKSPFFWSN